MTTRRIVDWKTLSKFLCAQHNQMGVAHVRPWDPPGAILVDALGAPTDKSEAPSSYVAVNLTSNLEELLDFPAREITPKEVRSRLWKIRDLRAFRRSYFFLWSVWSEEDGKSFVGVGAYVPPPVALRLAQMRTRTHAPQEEPQPQS